jgi:hypothetical protein
VKADQLNYAARRLGPGGDGPAADSFMVCAAIQPGLRARLLSASALAITVEWVSCAIMPALLAAIPLATSSGAVRGTAAAFTGVYALHLLAAEGSGQT